MPIIHRKRKIRNFSSCVFTAAIGGFMSLSTALSAQSVPPALVSPPARPPVTGSNGEQLIGMPKFHDPAPYDIDEHTGYKQIFDGKTFAVWDADPTIWRVEDGLMIGESRKGTTTPSLVQRARATSISSSR